MQNQNATPRSRRLLPPISALTAFEAVARCKSYTRAADELSLTQSAVSRQVANLEALLGTPLFETNRTRSVILTQAGTFFVERVRECLNNLSAATAATIAFNNRGNTLRLGVPVSFAGRWLIPRMGGFYSSHPDITVEFVTRVGPRSGKSFQDIDASIEFSDQPSVGMINRKLVNWTLQPVCSPALRDELGVEKLDDLSDIAILLHNNDMKSWFETASTHHLNNRGLRPMHFNHYTMLLQAAIAGIGVAIAPTCLIEREVANSDLVVLSGADFRSEHVGHLTYPPTSRDSLPLQTFEKWLLTQVSQLRQEPDSD